ncbi:TIGR04255 family protein [Blastopirellula sp. JC732]|uniref:TIGR04255 family protein n=1 Tax=Blastopirellula sediminis TaxID=2894196 RepID=A0A9X1SH34_9BACT|nr:TIGR04255 family protein [Blastopirellula sediminis]MCC9607341.1 TIGR04255 family protein [Blastopirellula sediminis]MCC9629366.1 TIGR04255 family protein [Blastopirellula sediminis]
MAKTPAHNTKTVLKYKKDYLVKVIARIDFAEPLGLQKEGPTRDVVATFKKKFPIPELKISTQKEIGVGLNQEILEKTSEIREWEFSSKSRHQKIAISEKSFVFSCKKYNKYSSLRADFLKMADAIFAAYPEAKVKRLGLRYVDHIDLDEPHPTKWEKYLHKDLLTIFNLADEPRLISRAFHVLEIQHDDETRLRFQYGMANPDFPARIKRKVFVLDIDVFSTLLLEPNEIPAHLDLFHHRTKAAFEQVITDELRKKMEVVYG